MNLFAPSNNDSNQHTYYYQSNACYANAHAYVLHRSYDVITSAYTNNYKRFEVRFINFEKSTHIKIKL